MVTRQTRTSKPNSKENVDPNTPVGQASAIQPSSRLRKSTQKVTLNNKKALEDQRQREKKRQERERRAMRTEARSQEEQVVQRSGDSDEVKSLKEQLEAARAEARIAMEHMAHMKSVGGNEDDTRKSFKKSKAQDTIKRPSNLSKVTVGDIRCHLGLDGPEGDQEWNRIRSTLRRCLTAGKIEWSKGWRDQKLRRLIRIYDAVDEACPAMRRFENQWATQFLAKEYFASHKTYGSCAFNPDTYRGRHRCKRRVVLQSPPSGASRSQTPVAGSSGMTGQTRRDNSGEQDIDMAAIPQDLPLLTDCEDEEGSEGEERRDVIGKGKGKAVEQPTRGRGRGRGRRH